MYKDKKHLINPWFRDVPTSGVELMDCIAYRSLRELTIPLKQGNEKSEEPAANGQSEQDSANNAKPKSKWHKHWPIWTTGAGLFSDGYINSSTSTITLCLSKIYGKKYSESHIIQNVSSIAFVGTVVGQLLFGYLADNYSRKKAMLIGTSLLILFSILCAGAWGVGTTSTEPGGLFAALTAYRFFLGIAIGSEYSSSSPAAAEAANLLPPGKRNRWFCWFTNFMIDAGFVVSSFVPFVLIWIFTPRHLNAVWRVTIGLGAIPPISLFFMRLKYKESKTFQNTKFSKGAPYWLIIKFYWFRTAAAAIIWFLYDFSAYAFGTYSSIIIDSILGDDQPIYKVFGWNVVFNLFYIPGAFLGAIIADYCGPRNTLAVGVLLQATVGYILAGCLSHLRHHIASFVVAYGIFMTLGEMSAGDNIGLVATKIGATPVRGQTYAVAAAVGKVGAFVGSYVFPTIIRNAGGYDSVKGLQAPYWVASTLCVFMSIVSYFLLPPMDQDAMDREDEKFLEYLQFQGYDISRMGSSDYGAEDGSTSDTDTATILVNNKLSAREQATEITASDD